MPANRAIAAWIKAIAIVATTCGLIVLSACSNQAQPSSQNTPAAATPMSASKVDTAAQSGEATAAPAQEENSAEPTPAQVSETDDGAESTEAPEPTPQAIPTLKLASVAKPEPKPAPSTFREGKHYQRLVPTQPTSAAPDQVEVVEFFWYGCPHCFAFDPRLENWRAKDKANYVVFRRIPIMWGDIHKFHARIFFAAEMLGKLNDMHTAIFREIHVNGNPLNSPDKAKAFFVSQGVAAKDFDKVFTSPAMEKKLQGAEDAMRRYGVQGVPFMTVNGKYTADVETAGGVEQLLQLVNELAAREHRG